MLHVITSETGKPRLIVQDAENRSYDEAVKVIQGHVMAEMAENGGLDYNNLSNRLHLMGFTIFGFSDFRTLGR